MSVDKKLATEVAKQLDRRRMRRKLLVLAALVAAVGLALLYLTCGQGFGLGGKGKGKGEGSGTSKPLISATADAASARCTVRVHAKGLTVDGKDVTREQAVATCKAATGADVVVTGDARQGDWDELRTALEQGGVAIYKRD